MSLNRRQLMLGGVEHELVTHQPPAALQALGLPRERAGWQPLFPLFPFRMGYSEKPAAPSMRRPMAEVLIT